MFIINILKVLIKSILNRITNFKLQKLKIKINKWNCKNNIARIIIIYMLIKKKMAVYIFAKSVG